MPLFISIVAAALPHSESDKTRSLVTWGHLVKITSHLKVVTQQRGVAISFEETWKRKTSAISTPKYEMAVCFFMRFKDCHNI